jgi:hypothetical protein
MDILEWLFSGASAPENPEVESAIDCLLQTVDPRLKALSGASRRLEPVARAALEFCDHAAKAMPGPLDASLAHWREASELRALFTQDDDVQRVFSHQDVVQDYVSSHPGASRFYALLGAVFEEKKHFGVVLQNGTPRHDVAIVTLNFRNHRLFLPRMCQETFERDLRWALFKQLALEILGHLSAMKEERDARREEIALLRTQLAYCGQQGLSRGLPGEDAAERASPASTPEALNQQLTTLQAEAGNHPMQTLEDTLEWVAQSLSAPEELLRMRSLEYHIDNANQVTAAGEDGRDLCLRHFSVTMPNPQAGVLLRVVYPIDELLPRRQIAADMERLYL